MAFKSGTYMVKSIQSKAHGLFLGLAIGDALGVPVEFMDHNDISDMVGNGTHGKPAGTFSDDSSLAFCLAEGLTHDFDLNDIAQNFIKWLDEGYWTADGDVFDVGGTTSFAIHNLKCGVNPDKAGGSSEHDNGNGSLMRIAPLLFYIYNRPIKERYEIIKNVSSMTHAHVRSINACFYYLEYMLGIYHDSDKYAVYKRLQDEIPIFWKSIGIEESEIQQFDQLLKYDIASIPQERVYSGGYVMETITASIWCLLNTQSYDEAVIKAVNLGHDTDTTACVTGGIAGLYYGEEGIRKDWIKILARHDDIINLADRVIGFNKCGKA
jgi:ADP-ribosylglycohydrolase